MFQLDKCLEDLDAKGTPIRTSLVGAGSMGSGLVGQIMKAPGMEIDIVVDTNIENAMSYGKAAFERGLYSEAVAPFNDILKQEPKNIIAMEYLGRCHESLNQMSKALSYYKEILQIEPRNVNVLCLTASVYGRLHEFKTARNYVQKAERVDRGNGLPNIIMAEVYENAVTYCMDKRTENKLEYDDKLVYSYAVDELKKATTDPNLATEAKRRIKQFDGNIRISKFYIKTFAFLTPK